MKIHEIERHQAQPQHLEIVLHLDPSLFWFQGILPYSRCCQVWHRLTGSCTTPPRCWHRVTVFTASKM